MLFFGTATASAQEAPAPADTTETHEVELSADMLVGSVENGETVRRLTGNVRLEQEETTLTSEQATQYPEREDILFTGHVRIVDEGDTLWAERVLYNRDTKIGHAEGDVRLSDGEVRLTAPSGVYFLDEKRAELEGGIRMVDSTAVLTSRRGQYWLDEKRAEFYEDVLLVEEGSNLEADSVTYFRETEVALANGNVFIEHWGGEETEEAEVDSTSRTYLFGASAYNDNREGFSRIMGQPILVQLDEDTAEAAIDTLVVRACILESTRTDSLERLIAIDSVRIWSRDLAAVADSVVSDRIEVEGVDTTQTREEIRFFGDPVAWHEQSQMTGDTIVVKAQSGALDSLLVFANAFVAQRDTVLDKIQQLRGHDMTGVFVDDSLRTLTVGPNAEVIHYLKGDENELTGAVQVSGDQVHFWFEQGEIRKIKMLGDNEGAQYDAELIPDPFTLEGYRWIPDRRPTKEQLLEGVEGRLPATPPPPAYTSTETP